MLIETIESVRRQAHAPNWIIVVDQTPAHEPDVEAGLLGYEGRGMIRRLRQSLPNLPLARNAALQATTADVVIFIDDDVCLCDGFIENHLRHYFEDDVVAVAGRVREARRPLVQGRRTWPIMRDYEFFDMTADVEIAKVMTFRGCNHSVRASAMRAIGGYDPNYLGWAYREDADAALRIVSGNRGRIVYDPRAALVHRVAPAGGCRTPDTFSARAEWRFSYPALYFSWRHLFPNPEFWKQILLRDVRTYVLRRAIVTRPWRLPMAALSYGYALARSGVVALGQASRRRGGMRGRAAADEQ